MKHKINAYKETNYIFFHFFNHKFSTTIKNLLTQEDFYYSGNYRFCSNIENYFTESLFIQFGLTTLALCMSELVLFNYNNDGLVFIIGNLVYLIILGYQIWQLCYTGAELTHAVLFQFNSVINF